MIIKSINPISAGKVTGLTYAGLALLIGALVSMVTLAFGGGGQGGAAGLMFGAGAIIILPIIYGIGGFIGGIIGALIYNLVAGMVGGIEIEVSDDYGRPRRRKSEEREEEW
jgi:hypothetical protein